MMIDVMKVGVIMNHKRKFMFIVHLAIIFLVSISLYCTGGVSFAQSLQYDASKGEYKRKDSELVTIIGKVINISYELQHRPGGAYAQDSLFSKGRQGLLTGGGTIWTFVDNVKGQDLQWNKEYFGKFVKINGWVFHDAQYIEIDSFSMDGQEYEWSNKTNSFEPTTNNKE